MATRNDEHRAQRVARILQAAGSEFACRGPFGARVDAIARAAGMNKRLLYHYVGDKEALFAAVVERGLTRLTEAGGRPEDVDRETWQVLVHAAASGASPDFSRVFAALEERAGPDGLRARLAESLLAQVLGPLADALPPPPAPRESAVAGGHKPRIKMRPAVRSR
jgi:AcrR family transcriptional regulator